MTDTATRPPAAPLDDPLPDEMQPALPAAPVVEQTYVMVPIGAIVPNPDNPRTDMGDLDGLVASIREHGIQQALAVERASPSTFMLLAGERRWTAAKRVGLAEVPCLIRQGETTAAQRLEIALVENLQREDLSVLDEAAAYRELVKLGLSQRAIAQRVGHNDQSRVSKRLALLVLPEPVQAQVGGGSITLEAAAALARLKDHPEKLEEVANAHPSRILLEVEEAEKDIAWQAKVDELEEIAEGKGWATVDEPRDQWAQRPFRLLAMWRHLRAELDIDPKKHEAEPCHAVMVPRYRNHLNEKPSVTSVCTEPGRHHAKGSSKLKVPPPPKPVPPPPKPAGAAAADKQAAADRKKREELQQQAEAAGAIRRAFLTKAVSEHKAPKSTSSALALSLRTLVWIADEWGVEDSACELLGVATDDPREWALSKYADAGDTELHSAALAVTLVEAEDQLHRGPWTSDRNRRHFDYLLSLGYELSPYEKAKLAEVPMADGDA